MFGLRKGCFKKEKTDEEKKAEEEMTDEDKAAKFEFKVTWLSVNAGLSIGQVIGDIILAYAFD